MAALLNAENKDMFCSVIILNIFSISSFSNMSAPIQKLSGDIFCSFFMVEVAFFSSLLVAITVAPIFANLMAVAIPIPDDAPEINICLSWNSPIL